MKRSHIFEADDGHQFDTAEGCERHEHKMFIGRLCALTEAEILAALDRLPSNLTLANDLERAGNIIAAKRRESGELRRKAKTPEKKP